MFKNKTVSLMQSLVFFMVFFSALVILGVNVIVEKWTDDIFARLQRDNLLEQTNELCNSISGATENCRIVLQDHARFPVITHGVMQPEFALANIADFMNDLSILGEKCQIVLLNYKGETIYSTKEFPHFDYSKEAWVKTLISGREDKFSGVSSDDGTFFFRIAVPVPYNHRNEGIMVAELPVSIWSRQFQNASMMDNSYMVLLYKKQVITTFGHKTTDIYQEAGLGHANLTLRYYGDFSNLEKNREILTVMLGTTLIVLFFFLSVIVFFVVNYGFSKSLVQLRSFAHELAGENCNVLVPVNQKITEIRQLAVDFNDMAAKIINRENALKTAKEQLEQQVAERTMELRSELAKKLKTEAELKQIQEELEDRVKARTMEIEKANNELQAAMRDLANTQGMLLQTEKMASIGQLAAGIAHEINNPAGFVSSNLNTLNEYIHDFETALDAYESLISELREVSGVPAEKVEKLKKLLAKLDLSLIRADIGELLKDTGEGMKRITKIISDLKDFSHVNKNEIEEYDLNTLIDKTINVAWNELKYKTEVIRDYGNLPIISGYAGQISQVIMNLLVNAAQAIPQKGEIHIRTWVEAPNVCISIRDTGSGIPADIIDKIFDPFFTTKPVGKGTGLGLNIVYNIIKAHNGEIFVSSKKDEGTMFTIVLPIEYHVDVMVNDGPKVMF